MKEKNLRYTNMNYRAITSPDINNGIGCRITVWVSGCTHKCPGCHNPEMWDYNQGKELFTESIVKKIATELNTKSYLKGITFSGGDPLDQSNDSLKSLLCFILAIKSKVNRDFDIWVYSGGVYENLIHNDIVSAILLECDVLVDGPYIQELRDITLPFRGSKNQRIIDLEETQKQGKIIEVDIDAKNS